MSRDYEWTKHALGKMRYYRLSESLVKRIVRYPGRVEEGIAPGTTAAMRPAPTKRPQEYWVMYREIRGRKLRIISAWRYPGVSPKGEEIPIPEDIREELAKELERKGEL